MSLRSQIFPPKPSFTADDTPSLVGKIYIVTGATSGVGIELAKILFSRSATVYIAARNEEKITRAIKIIKESAPTSHGRLVSMVVDLSNLTTIASAVETFKARESSLHGLVLNAGVMTPPKGSQGAQGHELQMTTNCLGGYLLSKCLEPLLISTAAGSPSGEVRIIWLSSYIQLSTPNGGIIWDKDSDAPMLSKDQMENYMMSKVGNVFLADDVAKRLADKGIISVSVNPGLMRTELQRNQPAVVAKIMGLLMKGPEYGAHSELFGLLSPEVTMEKSGAFIVPWGRFGCIPDSIKASMKDESQGGTGVARSFLQWCDVETKAYQ